MSRSNGSPILVAEVNRVEANRLARALKALNCTVRVADSSEQVIKLLRNEVFDAGLVAVELQIDKDSVLAYLSRFVTIRFRAAVGPADDPDAELRARFAGAQVYLPRPVTTKMLSALLWISNRDRFCSSSADESRRRSALADTRSGGWQVFSKRVFSKYDTGQTSSFSPFSLPGL